MSAIVWMAAVGERRPQQTPKRFAFVSRFEIERNCGHVHGFLAVGALMPACLRMSMFANTL